MEEPIRRKESASWNQFFTSGRIEDYLSYVAGERVQGFANTDWTGEGPHAGVYRSNGNHIETDAYR